MGVEFLFCFTFLDGGFINLHPLIKVQDDILSYGKVKKFTIPLFLNLVVISRSGTMVVWETEKKRVKSRDEGVDDA